LLPQLILALGGNAMAASAISCWALLRADGQIAKAGAGGEKCSGLRLDEAVYWLLWNVGDYHFCYVSGYPLPEASGTSSLLARLMIAQAFTTMRFCFNSHSS